MNVLIVLWLISLATATTSAVDVDDAKSQRSPSGRYSSDETYNKWRRLYDSVFVSSLSDPYESAITTKSAGELLNDLRKMLGNKETQIKPEERAEVRFWLELSIKDKFDSFVYCRKGFEQNIERRRMQLVKNPIRLRYYKANTPIPNDIKLDEYIAERRQSIFDVCTSSYGSYLTMQYNQLPPEVGARLHLIETLSSNLEDAPGEGETCNERCKIDKLASAVAKAIAPNCKTNGLLDLFCGMGLNRKQFDKVYDSRLLEPCESVSQKEGQLGNALDLFLRYADEYWYDQTSGSVRQWLQIRRVCEYIKDESFGSRAFHFVPKVRRELKNKS